MQGQLGAVGDGAEELLGQLGVEAGDRGRRQVGVEDAERPARRCRSRTRPATRPSAPGPSRSGGSRRGRRAPRRAPGRARCRRPRPCGGRRSRGRRSPRPRRPSRPWRASRSSMWSRKPTPVSALASPPSRSSESLICVSAVLRSLVAVRLTQSFSSALIIADSPWTGKPSARAIVSTCGASFAAASAGISTVEILRRKVPGPERARRSGRRRRSAARGWSRRRSRRRRSRRSGRRRRSPRSSPCRRAAPRPPRSARGARGRRRWRARSRRLGSGTWTSASGASATLGRAAAASRHRLLDRVEDVLLDRGDDQRAVRPVLGLGAEVECDPLRVGVVAGDHHQLRRPGERVDPDHARRPRASPPAPRRCRGRRSRRPARSSRCRRRARRSPGRRRSRRSRRPRRARRRRGRSGASSPSGPGGEASAIRSTPATRAGIAHISTLDG